MRMCYGPILIAFTFKEGLAINDQYVIERNGYIES